VNESLSSLNSSLSLISHGFSDNLARVKWWKHAFAVEPPGEAEPNDVQRMVIEKLCLEVARRRMITPALLILEMSRPLNFVSAQFLHFVQPVLSPITNAGEYQAFSEFLEQRGSIEYICKRLESLESNPGSEPHATD
jgi:hypothetical protein